MLYQKPVCPHCEATFHIWQARDKTLLTPGERKRPALLAKRAKCCPHCGGRIALEARSGIRLLLILAVGLVAAFLVPAWFGALVLVAASVLGVARLRYTVSGKERN